MPKVNVYLPDKLAAEVRAAGVPVSAVCQRALERVAREVGPLQAVIDRPSIFGIYGRLLHPARQSLDFAFETALARQHHKIETEDLLAGILQQGANLAVHIIETLGVSPDDVLIRIYDRSSAGAAQHHNATFDMLMSDDTKRALSLAARRAVLAHEDRRYIGNEELLYGLAAAEGTLAATILAEFGIDSAAVERTCHQQLHNWMAADYADLIDDDARDASPPPGR